MALPIYHYLLNNNLTDEITGNNAISITPQYVAGISPRDVGGKAWDVDATNQRIQLQAMTGWSLDPVLSPWSVSFWLYIDAAEGTAETEWLSFYSGANTNAYRLRWTNGVFGLAVRDNAAWLIDSSSGTYPKENLYHVVWSDDGAGYNQAHEIKLWINAVQDAGISSYTPTFSGSYAGGTALATFCCDNWLAAFSRALRGRYDDIRFYNSVLTASQIKELYTGSKSKHQQTLVP
jgi:hypothetical protein